MIGLHFLISEEPSANEYSEIGHMLCQTRYVTSSHSLLNILLLGGEWPYDLSESVCTFFKHKQYSRPWVEIGVLFL